MTPRQCIAARALLGWNQADLAREAGVNKWTIVRLERAKHKPFRSTTHAIEAAFVRHGLSFACGGVIVAALREGPQ